MVDRNWWETLAHYSLTELLVQMERHSDLDCRAGKRTANVLLGKLMVGREQENLWGEQSNAEEKPQGRGHLRQALESEGIGVKVVRQAACQRTGVRVGRPVTRRGKPHDGAFKCCKCTGLRNVLGKVVFFLDG